MPDLQPWEDFILKDGEAECSFFEFCQRNQIIVEIVRKSGSRVERIEGFLNEYEPEQHSFSVKGMEGGEYAVPFSDVVCIRIKGRG